jgi:hypothetical protein
VSKQLHTESEKKEREKKKPVRRFLSLSPCASGEREREKTSHSLEMALFQHLLYMCELTCQRTAERENNSGHKKVLNNSLLFPPSSTATAVIDIIFHQVLYIEIEKRERERKKQQQHQRLNLLLPLQQQQQQKKEKKKINVCV